MPELPVELRDIHLPASPGLWPPAPGWWLLAAAVLAVLVWGMVRGQKLFKVRRFRQTLRGMLEALEKPRTEAELPAFLTEVSTLLRRVAVNRYGREKVAPLHGGQWLAFLDQHSGASGSAKDFSHGAGKLLAEGPYLPTTGRELSTQRRAQITALLDISQKWMRHNAGNQE